MRKTNLLQLKWSPLKVTQDGGFVFASFLVDKYVMLIVTLYITLNGNSFDFKWLILEMFKVESRPTHLAYTPKY